MPRYEVNVRAVVRATPLSADASGRVEGWEVYDHVAQADGTVVLRCDQAVTVEAEDEDKAVEAAKADAGAIVVEGYEIDDVSLWVDEGIDVAQAADAGATP